MIRYREEEIACLRESEVVESHSYCFILDVEFEPHTFLYSGILFPICFLEIQNQCEEFETLGEHRTRANAWFPNV